MAQKTVLIIYAHQSPASFNAAARDVAVQALTKQGYKVLVSDLYAMNFKASATPEDIKGDLKNPEHFIYNDELMVAWQDGRLRDDIAEEQRKLEQAELVIFQSGVLHFCGFQVLAPQIFWCPAQSPPEVRSAMLEAWRERLNGIFAEKPLSYAPTKYFDLSLQGEFCLLPEIKEKYASESHGITTGQHLGKLLPPDNQTKAK